MSNYSVTFICRASKASKKDGKASVECIISVGNNRAYVTLPRHESPSVFSRESKRRKSATYEFLSACQQSIDSYVVTLLREGKGISLEALKSYVSRGFSSSVPLREGVAEFLRYKSNCDICPAVYRKYELTLSFFLSVVDGGRLVSSVSECDIMLLREKLQERFDVATVRGYFSRVKSFFIYAVSRGYCERVPFSGLSVKREKKELEVLSEADYRKILERRFSIDRLEKVRELFVLGCCTGLSYCDMMDVKPSDIRRWKDSDYYLIEKSRKKTNVKYYAVVLPEGFEILKKYDYDLSPLHMSNQKINAYLKEIYDLCNVTSVSSLHFHLARKQYAMRLLNSNVDVSIVSKCLGHSSTKVTLSTYCRLRREVIVDSVINSMSSR